MEEAIRGYNLASRPRGRMRRPGGSRLFDGLGPFQEWELEAACHDLPIEWFFGIEPDEFHRDDEDRHRASRTRAQTAQAKAVCASCPVRAECLELALEHRIGFGIYGGLTEHERRQLNACQPKLRGR